mmetsp:Transcript_30869/g.46866  ORF Transcript_30869/g.46866 Transcript_30869/m.46866 type:complete len:467 (-) Transcript_30869:140-1540(-)
MEHSSEGEDITSDDDESSSEDSLSMEIRKALKTEYKSEDERKSKDGESSLEESLPASMISNRPALKIESISQQDSTDSEEVVTTSHDETENPHQGATCKIESDSYEARASLDIINKRRTTRSTLGIKLIPRSGSMFKNFPTSVSHDRIRLEEAYLRRLKKAGLRRLNKERKNRRIQREKLQLAQETLQRAGFPHTMENNTHLLSSSSDDSYVQKTTNLPLIDWDNAEWGHEEPFCKYMTMKSQEACSLVGWATHLSSDTPCSQNDHLDLPNTPLPPSILDEISRQASSYQYLTWRKRKIHLKKKRRKRRKQGKPKPKTDYRHCQPKWPWKYGYNDEDYQWLKKNWKPKKIPLTLPFPARGKNNFSMSLDISAKVALGMVVEEVVTASLMPFARMHVASCLKKEDGFNHWTIPPEEAILDCPEKSHLPCLSDATAIQNWCISRNHQYPFVKRNAHLYSKVLPMDSLK